MSYNVKRIEIEIIPGTSIEDAASDAVDLAQKFYCTVKFTFNGKELSVTSSNDIQDILKQYNVLRKL